MKALKFIWVTSLCVALGMGLVSCGDDNEEIEPSSEKEMPENSSDHEWVDMGLSVKWATCNVGATSPEDYGDHYAWGETETKDFYDWGTYKWGKGSGNTMTKYFYTVDNKTVLESSDDVAHVKWGSNWRMPTEEEMTELRRNCTWTWTTQGGKKGFKVTGPSRNSIFLPAAGYRSGSSLYFEDLYGYYWSSSLYPISQDSAWDLPFISGSFTKGFYYDYRIYGQSVRPVCP